MTAETRTRRPKVFKSQDEAKRAYLAQAGEVKITNDILDYLIGQGFKAFHDQDSRLNQRGFTDIVAVGHGYVIAWEMKTPSRKSQATKEQREWLLQWRRAGVDAGVVRTTAWFNGEINAFVQQVVRVGKARAQGRDLPWPRLASLEVPPECAV